MIRFSVPRSRLGALRPLLATTRYPAGVDVSYSTTQQQPDAVVHRVRCDKEEKGNR
jgi:hypothetical protein